jgi:hypothetical protein
MIDLLANLNTKESFFRKGQCYNKTSVFAENSHDNLVGGSIDKGKGGRGYLEN